MLVDKYVITRRLEIITEAIEHGRACLNGEQQENTQEHLYSLAMALIHRSTDYGIASDIDNAIAVLISAFSIAEKSGSPNERKLSLRRNLALALREKFRMGDGTQLGIADTCIWLCRQNLADTPPDDAHYQSCQYELAGLLYLKGCSIQDESRFSSIEEAISILTQLVGKQGMDVHRKAICEIDFAGCLLVHSRKPGFSEDLDRSLDIAIRIQQEPISTVPYVLDRALTVIILAFYQRYKKTGYLVDLEASIRFCHKLTKHEDLGSKRNRITSLAISGRLNYNQSRYEAALSDFQQAVELLPQLLTFGRDRFVEAIVDRATLGVLAAATAAANGQPSLALQLQELGRSVAWTRALQMRGDVGGLETDYPDYANRFKELSELCEEMELFQPRFSPFDGAVDQVRLSETASERRLVLSNRWDALVEEIRNLDGYEDFLSSPDYDKLKAVSKFGPVVVFNICEYRNDAFILTHSTLDRPQLVCLRDDLHIMIDEWSDEMLMGLGAMNDGRISERHFSLHVLNRILRQLWEHIVRPVRRALDCLTPYARRIWWCPTGRLTFLPLHLVTNGLSENETHMQLIPSYAITISSLLQARSSLALRKDISMLAVCCERPRNSEYQRINGTTKEVKALRNMLGRCETTVLQDASATVQRVVSEMSNHTWLHLACHGVQKSDDPYSSHFALSDGPLQMADIVSTRLQKSEFAFLSACQTASGVPSLCDEAMHLAAGLHFAGFCGIVATMWSVHDATAKKVAKEVYAYLLRDTNVPPKVEDAAEALWRAIQTLKAQGVPISRLAPFIHMGVRFSLHFHERFDVGYTLSANGNEILERYSGIFEGDFVNEL